MELGNIFYQYISMKGIALFFYLMHASLGRFIIN